jgi:hypothetical protein
MGPVVQYETVVSTPTTLAGDWQTSVAKYFGDFVGPGDDDSEWSSRTSAMDAHIQRPIKAGTTVVRSWIITGTLDEVAALMTDLYAAGVR